MAGTRSLYITFSQRHYDELLKISNDSGLTVSETIAKAVVFAKLAEEARANGGRILIERNGKTEVVSLE